MHDANVALSLTVLTHSMVTNTLLPVQLGVQGKRQIGASLLLT